MKRIIRLASADDEPAVRGLQAQFIEEMHDPLGIAEGSFARSDFAILEVDDGRERRVVGMTSMMRASPAPFVFEQVFPDVWQRFDAPALTGRPDVQRDDLVESDWGFIEKAYRGQGLALLLLAASLLHARRQGRAIGVGIPNDACKAAMPRGAFRPSGLSTHLSGVRYELGTFDLDALAGPLTDLLRTACRRDPDLVIRHPGAAHALEAPGPVRLSAA